MSGINFKTYFYINNNLKRKFNTFHDALEDLNNLIIDSIGIIQFVKFLHPLYKRTFIKDIKFGYTWENGEKLYFKYNEERKNYSSKNEDLLWNIIINSLKRICFDKDKIYGVGNSGGLDSRTILYILNKLDVDLVGYTFGDYPSDAGYITSKTARILKIKNKIIRIENNFFQKYWETVLYYKPMYSLLYSWYYSVLKNLPYFDVNITGFNGDNMLGSHLSKDLFLINNKSQLYKLIYNHYSRVPDVQLKLILKDKSLIDNAYNDYIKNIINSENNKKENIFEEFNFKCRQLRFINNSINFDFCGKYKWYSPFCSKEFLDFALNLTFKERYQRKLYYNMARKYMKEFNKLRFERTFKSLKDKNKLKILIKNYLWNFDKKYNLRLYYKGPHKDINKWLKFDNNFKFIKNKFKIPSKHFDRIFKTDIILKNLDLIFQKNKYLFFNLLTIKLWLNKFVE